MRFVFGVLCLLVTGIDYCGFAQDPSETAMRQLENIERTAVLKGKS